jgi:hypothetical protein
MPWIRNIAQDRSSVRGFSLAVTVTKWLQVTLCLFSLGRTTQKHPEYTGPMIGPKMATENKRNFTEEQILQGRNAQIGLQAGSNKGASQV